MFDSAISALTTNINTIKAVLRTNEEIRQATFSAMSTSAPVGTIIPAPLADIVNTAPQRNDWLIFDHCAGLTRLYAVYEQCITDLVTEYLRLLPTLYSNYTDLNITVRNQHRTAVGQILQKWSETSSYRHLTELQIIRGLTEGLAGRGNYSLLAEAFLIDPQNYRAELIQKIFSYLGFTNCWMGIQRHPRMVEYLGARRDSTETPQTILHDIVEHRNDASHSNISSIVSVDEIVSYADFVQILCEALAVMLKRGIIKRQIQIGHAKPVGEVLKVFGKAIGVKASAVTLTAGDELIAALGESISWGTINSIKKLAECHTTLQLKAGEEFGLKLSMKVKVGTLLYRPPIPTIAPEVCLTDEIAEVADAPEEEAEAEEDESASINE